jgi:dihydroxyacetone kinase-like predicted kinase
MPKYSLEFILHIQDATVEIVKNSIREFGEDIEVRELPRGDAAKGKDLNIHIRTEDPTIVFDICAEFGRIKRVKIH